MSFDFEAYSEDENNYRKSLFISKTYSNSGSLSYFGGRPMLPSEIEWPKGICGTRTRSMPFLAQIDLSDLPDGVIDGAPTEGIVHFYLDENLIENGLSKNQCVFYHEKGEKILPCDQSEPLSPIIGQDLFTGGNVYNYRTNSADTHFPRRIFPKYEIQFQEFSDIYHPCRYIEDELRFQAFDDPFIETDLADDFWDTFKDIEIQKVFTCLEKMFGSENAHLRLADYQYRYGGILDPKSELSLRERELGISPLLEEWPQAWIHVGLYLASSSVFGCDSYEFNRLPDRPLKHKFDEECRTWIDRAKKGGLFNKLTRSDRDEFKHWVSEHFCKSYRAWLENDDREINVAIKSLLQDDLTRSALDATTLCLDLEQSDRTIISESAKTDYLNALEPSDIRHNYHKHQLFGFGTYCQDVPNAPVDGKILLLQLCSDDSMLWMFHDVGYLQYWISEDDFRNKRFHRAFATMNTAA